MHLTWKERLIAQPELQNFRNWPFIHGNELPLVKRKTFFRNIRVVKSVLAGSPLEVAARRENLSKGRVSQIMTRCLSGDDKDEAPLTKALIGGYRVKRGLRKLPVSDGSSIVGTRGSFQYLLDNVPGLKEKLDKLLVSSISRYKNGQNLTPAAFHNALLRLLIELGWDKHSYPFDQEKLGYESCRKYYHLRSQKLRLPKKDNRRQIVRRKFTGRPYQEIQIDSQIVDVNMSIVIQVNGQSVSTRISRLSLFIAIDVATQCILSYHLCLTKDPTQSDLLNLLEGIHRQWEPLELSTPGLSYEHGACLPSSISELHAHAGIGMIRLDNALCHMSHLVRDYICNSLDATLNFGLPAHPKGRSFIEYAFRRLNKSTHRFPSTTGSNPKDPIKESNKNSKYPPVLTLAAFEETLSVLLTGYNVEPQERLGGQSPLAVMKNEFHHHFCRISFSSIHNKASAFTKRKAVQVKCILHENRKPHLNFMGLRYTGESIGKSELIGETVNIEYDIRDIRKLSVSTVHGDILGHVFAPRSWQNYPISTHTKSKISKETRKKRLHVSDPMAGYFAYLLENKELPKVATEIVRLQRETKLDLSKSENDDVLQTLVKQRKMLKKVVAKIPKWTTEINKVSKL